MTLYEQNENDTRDLSILWQEVIETNIAIHLKFNHTNVRHRQRTTMYCPLCAESPIWLIPEIVIDFNYDSERNEIFDITIIDFMITEDKIHGIKPDELGWYRNLLSDALAHLKEKFLNFEVTLLLKNLEV